MKKRTFTVFSLATVSAFLAIGTIINLSNDNYNTFAYNFNDDGTISMHMNNNNNKINLSTDFTEGTSICKTAYDNKINFKYSKTKSAADDKSWQILLDQGTFYNLNPINGLASIIVDANGPLKISYGYKLSTLYAVDVTLNPNQVYDFGKTSPCYFQIKNDSGVEVNITKIDLDYTCKPHQDTTLEDGIAFESSDGNYMLKNCTDGVTITKYLGKDQELIKVPQKIDNKTVRCIEKGAFKNEMVKAKAYRAAETSETSKLIYIPSTIDVIQNGAFDVKSYFCTDAHSINVGWIDEAIKNKTESLTNILLNADFNYIHVHDGIVYYYSSTTAALATLFVMSTKANIIIPDFVDNIPVYEIASYTFSYNPFVKTVKLPRYLTGAYGYPFYNCTNLEQIIYNENSEGLYNDSLKIRLCPKIKNLVTPIGHNIPFMNEIGPLSGSISANISNLYEIDEESTITEVFLDDTESNLKNAFETYINPIPKWIEGKNINWHFRKTSEVTSIVEPSQLEILPAGSSVEGYFLGAANDSGLSYCYLPNYPRQLFIVDNGHVKNYLSCEPGFINHIEGMICYSSGNKIIKPTEVTKETYNGPTNISYPFLDNVSLQNVEKYYKVPFQVQLKISEFRDNTVYFEDFDDSMENRLTLYGNDLRRRLKTFKVGDIINIKATIKKYSAKYELSPFDVKLYKEGEASEIATLKEAKQDSIKGKQYLIKGSFLAYSHLRKFYFVDSSGDVIEIKRSSIPAKDTNVNIIYVCKVQIIYSSSDEGKISPSLDINSAIATNETKYSPKIYRGEINQIIMNTKKTAMTICEFKCIAEADSFIDNAGNIVYKGEFRDRYLNLTLYFYGKYYGLDIKKGQSLKVTGYICMYNFDPQIHAFKIEII